MTGTIASSPRLAHHLRAARLPTALLAAEPELMETKWFDYRFLHPEEATRRFAETYVAAFRDAWVKYMDRDESGLKQALKNAEMEQDGSERTALWTARQAADRLGIPYDFFCRSSIAACLDRGCKRPPRPNQLYGKLILAQVKREWDELTAVRLAHAEDERYLAQNWTGHPAQQDHARWLAEQAAGRAHPQFVLRKVIHDRPMLPEDIARASFPGREHLFDLAKNERAYPEVLPPPRELGMDFGCLGLPHAFVAGKNVCRACPSAPACEAESRQVLAEVEARFGSATPAADRKREQARARKANQRARERAKKADKEGLG